MLYLNFRSKEPYKFSAMVSTTAHADVMDKTEQATHLQ